MSFIRIFRNGLRALSPAFLASRHSAFGTETLSAEGETAVHTRSDSRAGCWLDRNRAFDRDGNTRGSFVDAGESYYRASRERTMLGAMYDGSMR